jgi:hypothetical protein
VQSDLSSFRRDQLLAAVSALLLLVLLFALDWYGPGAITPTDQVTSPVNGWHGLIHVRWLLLVTIAFALVTAALGALAPRSRLQLPFSAILTLLALATLLWLGYRVLVSIPPGETAAAYAGLVCALGILGGGGAALLRELRAHDGEGHTPTSSDTRQGI